MFVIISCTVTVYFYCAQLRCTDVCLRVASNLCHYFDHVGATIMCCFIELCKDNFQLRNQPVCNGKMLRV